MTTGMPLVYVRDETRATIGLLSNWTEFQLVQRRNDAGRWTLTTSDPHDAELLEPPDDNNGVIDGARGVVIRLIGNDGEPFTVASGWVEGITESNDGTSTTWVASGFDDTIFLADSLCWPVPGDPIEDQPDRDDVRTGQASDRIRAYALENISKRLEIPGFGTGSEWHRIGPEGTSRSRFGVLMEAAQEAAGEDVNFRVLQQTDEARRLLLEMWEPPDRRQELIFSPELGTVTGWEHSYEPAESSRVILALGGERTEGDEEDPRVFREYSGHITEQELGGVRKIETFEDQGSISTVDDDNNPAPGWQQEAMDHAITYLEERRLRPSFKFTATGAPWFRAGVDFSVGDRVRAYKRLTPLGKPVGLIEDLIEEITTTWSASGESSEVRIGGEDGYGLRIERRLRRAMRKLRYLERQK